MDIEFCLFSGKKYKFKNKKKKKILEDYFQEDFVLCGKKLKNLSVIHYLNSNIKSENVKIRTDQFSGVAPFVSEGMGLGPLPFYFDRGPFPLKKLISFPKEFSGTAWIFTHPELYPSQRIQVFFEFTFAGYRKSRL